MDVTHLAVYSQHQQQVIYEKQQFKFNPIMVLLLMTGS